MLTQKAHQALATRGQSNGNGTGDVCETTEVTITANKDASVHSRVDLTDPTKHEVDLNHNHSNVEILSKSSYTVAGLFGFNWYDNITSSQTVVSATLRLTIGSSSGASNYHVYGSNPDV